MGVKLEFVLLGVLLMFTAVGAACCLPMNLSGSGEADYAVRNGQLTNKFMFTANLIILIACAVFLLFAVRREEKINESGLSK